MKINVLELYWTVMKSNRVDICRIVYSVLMQYYVSFNIHYVDFHLVHETCVWFELSYILRILESGNVAERELQPENIRNW